MAAPIPLNLAPRDPREALFRRLENAPQEHAEALLAAYDVLQGLHDRGVLELAKGALGSSEKLLQILVAAGREPEVIQGIRNAMILANLLHHIPPELLEDVERSVSKDIASSGKSEPPGLWRLLRMALSEDTRRALGVILGAVMAFGKGLRTAAPPRP